MVLTEKKRLWLKEYRKRNKIHIAKVAKAKYKRNSEKYKKHRKQKYKENPEHFLKIWKESWKRHPETRRRIWNNQYQKHREEALVRSKTRYHFGNLIKEGKCDLCGSNVGLEFHHTKPYKYDEFQLICEKCHGKIHNMKYRNKTKHKNRNKNEVSK